MSFISFLGKETTSAPQTLHNQTLHNSKVLQRIDWKEQIQRIWNKAAKCLHQTFQYRATDRSSNTQTHTTKPHPLTPTRTVKKTSINKKSLVLGALLASSLAASFPQPQTRCAPLDTHPWTLDTTSPLCAIRQSLLLSTSHEGIYYKGIHFYFDQNRYEGDFVNGERTGKGTFFFSNGECYEGDFLNGRLNGKGTLLQSNGNRYEGDFLNGERTGKGTLFWANGERYEGDFVKGERTGKGTLFWTNEERYEGDFIKGQFTGKGTLFRSNGNRYEGDFLNGERTGKGTLFWPLGNRYEGDFINGERTGKGTMFWSNGDQYEGDFINGQCTGKGTLFWSNGDHYEGDFINGERTGKGRSFWANRKRHEGNYFNGNIQGKGTFFLDNGERHEGNCFDGHIQGKGTLVALNERLEVEFVNNYPIGNLSHLNSSLFLNLLVQTPQINTGPTFPLGILSDYLIHKGYQEVGESLKSALQIKLIKATPQNMQTESAKLYETVHRLNQPILLSLTCASRAQESKHALGLKIEQTMQDFVDFEIYNSGFGLSHHTAHLTKKQTYQTAWKKRAPLASLTEEHLTAFLQCTDVDEVYKTIDRLSGSKSIVPDAKAVIWQKRQLGDNCTLMWIFAYLKNVMKPQEYAAMRAQLFTDCAYGAQQASNPDPKIIAQFKQQAAAYTRLAIGT